MKYYIRSIFVIFAVFLFSCSKKEMYQAGQNYQKNQCMNKAGTQSQLEECDRIEKKSFEDYEEERKEVVDK